MSEPPHNTDPGPGGAARSAALSALAAGKLGLRLFHDSELRKGLFGPFGELGAQLPRARSETKY
eukprot:3291803-Alexandrium_andersonii.AAC.1